MAFAKNIRKGLERLVRRQSRLVYPDVAGLGTIDWSEEESEQDASLQYKDLIAVRAYSNGDIAIKDGKLIPSPGRPTQHFTLNHFVKDHFFANWGDSKSTLLVPFEPLLEANRDRFVGGYPADVFFVGPLNLDGIEYSVIERPGPDNEEFAQKVKDKIESYQSQIESGTVGNSSPLSGHRSDIEEGRFTDAYIRESYGVSMEDILRAYAEDETYIELVHEAIEKRGCKVEVCDPYSWEGKGFFDGQLKGLFKKDGFGTAAHAYTIFGETDNSMNPKCGPDFSPKEIVDYQERWRQLFETERVKIFRSNLKGINEIEDNISKVNEMIAANPETDELNDFKPFRVEGYGLVNGRHDLKRAVSGLEDLRQRRLALLSTYYLPGKWDTPLNEWQQHYVGNLQKAV